MFPGELSFSEPNLPMFPGEQISANLPTNVPSGELSFSEPTYQCPLGN